ncbi:hypothetical protein [Cupriavidus neocaledonicus]|uniref:Uncharacterized protein n=2 Tax=Cupriavidus neocaledonicus TaxID=1040979 RepID=A0ABY1V445_9BURK|nr:hypothetical protein [Cupriavidus neocaledonicus]SOZ37023.1 conserved hypothetical protein [Cupriavidus neocaledonicus]
MKPDQLSPPESITLHMEGMQSDDGDLRLGMLIDKLIAFRATLSEADKYLSGIDKPTVDLLVSDLTHNSPAAITIRATPHANVLNPQTGLFSYLADLINDINDGRYEAASASHLFLERLGDLCLGVGDKLTQMWLSRGKERVATVTPQTRTQLQSLLSRTYSTYGHVKGKVERYNSHGDVKYFYVYSLLGSRVKCAFPDDLRELAAQAVEKSVDVSGLLKYREGEYFPHEVQVQAIEILPADNQLSTLSSLSGVAPDATGEKTSIEFIRDRRNGWH